MSNMDREILTAVLPQTKKTVKYYCYITARENREWLKVISNSEEGKIDSVLNAQDFIFKTLILEFDGSSDDINERMLDLPKKDFTFIDKILAEIIKVEDFLEKEKN